MIRFVFAVGWLFSISSAAQTPEEILRTVWKDPRVQLHAEAKQVVVAAKSINPLDKADLRIDRGQLEQDDVKYALRFYPKGFSEHRTTQEFQSTLEKTEETAYRAALSQNLAARYDLLSRVALHKEKKSLSTSLNELTRKAGRALSLNARKDRNEIKSFLKNQSDLGKLSVQSADIDRDYEMLQAELKERGYGSIDTIDLSDFATMDDLQSQLQKTPETKTQTLSATLADQELKTSRAEMNYERAKDEKWFDHLEVSISDIRRETVYGFEFAFNLPFASAPNLSRIGKEARELRDKAKLIETVELSDRTYQNSLIELKTLLKLHKGLQQSQARMNPAKMKKATQSIAGQDPVLAIELQRGWFETREQILDLEYRIRSLYILYLHESSTLAQNPEVNYFSKSLRKIL